MRGHAAMLRCVFFACGTKVDDRIRDRRADPESMIDMIEQHDGGPTGDTKRRNRDDVPRMCVQHHDVSRLLRQPAKAGGAIGQPRDRAKSHWWSILPAGRPGPGVHRFGILERDGHLVFVAGDSTAHPAPD
jgi:hypothetical protein